LGRNRAALGGNRAEAAKQGKELGRSRAEVAKQGKALGRDRAEAAKQGMKRPGGRRGLAVFCKKTACAENFFKFPLTLFFLSDSVKFPVSRNFRYRRSGFTPVFRRFYRSVDAYY
jgi:hypothetical protein